MHRTFSLTFSLPARPDDGTNGFGNDAFLWHMLLRGVHQRSQRGPAHADGWLPFDLWMAVFYYLSLLTTEGKAKSIFNVFHDPL